jgi:hypothetical protein
VVTLKAIDKVSPGPDLDALVAEDVFRWKSVHRHQGGLFGKKQDKLGRWRSAKVPNFSTNPIHASAIEERMKELGLLERYNKELSKMTHAKSLPLEWATPDQRCRAAINLVRSRSRLRIVKK